MYLTLFLKMSLSFFGSWFLHPYPHSRHNILLLWFSSSFLSNIYDTTATRTRTTTSTTINRSDATNRIRSILFRQRECYKDLQVYHSYHCTATHTIKLNNKHPNNRYKYLQAFQSFYRISDRTNRIGDNFFCYSNYEPSPTTLVSFNKYSMSHCCFLSNRAFDKSNIMFNVQHNRKNLEESCHDTAENQQNHDDEINHEVLLSNEQLINTIFDTNNT